MNITQLIRTASSVVEREAVIEGDFSASYGRMFTDIDNVKQQLLERGLKRGMSVALMAQDSYRYIVVSLAILDLECAIITIPVNTPAGEIDADLKQVKANCMVFEQNCCDCITGNPLSVPGAGVSKFLITFFAGNIGMNKLPDGRIPAFIRFSSGTTGKRKGVIISHQAIIARTAAANKGLNITADDNILWMLDMAFHFVVTILLFLQRRATIVIAGSSLPEKIVGSLQQRPVTVIYATPFHYRLMIQMDIFDANMFTDIRMAISTAMTLDAEVGKSFEKKFGFALRQAYGIIEVGLPFINDSADQTKLTSVGRILPDYKLKIAHPDEQGRGVIMLNGPGMFDAYAAPFILAEDIMVHGWFNTGDIGIIDHDGYLFITGREKNVINFIGMKIFPNEVEQVIKKSGLVDEVKVYGKAHQHFGEVPVAELVAKDAAVKTDELAKQLRRFCYDNLPDYSVPKDFIFVSQISKTASGKIIRRNNDKTA